jgi:hypothetical protein
MREPTYGRAIQVLLLQAEEEGLELSDEMLDGIAGGAFGCPCFGSHQEYSCVDLGVKSPSGQMGRR